MDTFYHSKFRAKKARANPSHEANGLWQHWIFGPKQSDYKNARPYTARLAALRGDAVPVKRPPHKPLAPTKVSKAVRLPKHPSSGRLGKLLGAIDAVHLPGSLKTIPVVMDRRVAGGVFYTHADTGPFAIYLNPDGNHLELSLLHEVGHYLEWQCIPKDRHSARDFSTDQRFAIWLQTVFETPTVQSMVTVLGQQHEGTPIFRDVDYSLRPNELWTRAYSQYIARKMNLSIIFQQIAAENQVVTGIIKCKPYWEWDEFAPLQDVMDAMFEELGWSK